MELLDGANWVRAKLLADSALVALVGQQVFLDVIPHGATLPAVRIHVQSPGVDMIVINGIRIWANPLFLVTGVCVGAPDQLAAIENRIDAVLHRATGVTATIRVVACLREMPYQMSESDIGDGKIYRHSGGLYRIKIQQL